MALVLLRKVQRFGSLRYKSTCVPEKDIKKSVFISQSKDIYTNLALEDWLYKNFDLCDHHVLLFWRNEPCVVIGQDRNPWLEASNGARIARRTTNSNSLFHDEGNLNMTFFTPKNRHNKIYDLELIIRGIFREYGIRIKNSASNLTLRNSKQISSGTVKLGHTNAYHHCSLLVNVNKLDLSEALNKPEIQYETKPIKSDGGGQFMNLCEEEPKISFVNLLKAVGWEFLRTSATSLKDGGMELANKQKGFHMVNPTEYWFPGITEIRNNFESWNWRYGKTPKFNVTRTFPLLETCDTTINPLDYLKVQFTIDHGKFDQAIFQVSDGAVLNNFSGEIEYIESLKGQQFSEDALENCEQILNGMISEKYSSKKVMLSF